MAMDIITIRSRKNQRREHKSMGEVKEENKIDIISMLGTFYKTIKKFWLFMLILVLVSVGIYYLYARIQYQPVYQSEATFSVNTSGSTTLGSGNLVSEQVKESLPYIMNSDVMKNMIMDDLGLTWFPAKIQLESKESVNMFTVRVTANDAQTSYTVLQSLLKKCPSASVYVLGKIELEILDDSGMPSAPVNGYGSIKNLIVGAVGGIVLSCVFALAYTLTNRTIQNEEDFRKYLSISCISKVPFITFKKRRKQIDKHIHIHNDKVGYGFIEAFRTIRTRVEREMDRIGGSAILVTSSIPGEGKSTIASNIALSLAETGNSVVLVDLDLRNPSLESVLGLEEEKDNGVAELLEKKKTLEEVLRYEEGWDLWMITGGAVKSDPTKLLNSNAVSRLVTVLKEQFDYVVLDTPPAAMLADAAAIARSADCALYVVRQDVARIERIAEGIDALTMAHLPIIGAVLNSFEGSLGNYGGYQYGRYGHYGAYSKQQSNSEYVEMEEE